MATSLPDSVTELVDRTVIAAFSTLHADAPHMTPMSIGRDGDELVVITASSRVKTRNVQCDPRVALRFVDPLVPLHVVALEHVRERRQRTS